VEANGVRFGPHRATGRDSAALYRADRQLVPPTGDARRSCAKLGHSPKSLEAEKFHVEL